MSDLEDTKDLFDRFGIKYTENVVGDTIEIRVMVDEFPENVVTLCGYHGFATVITFASDTGGFIIMKICE